jgi:hypothetical protein
MEKKPYDCYLTNVNKKLLSNYTCLILKRVLIKEKEIAEMKSNLFYSIAAIAFVILLSSPMMARSTEEMSVIVENFSIADSGMQQWMPRIAYNAIDNEYMVLWHTDGIRGKDEPATVSLDGQRISASGGLLGEAFLIMDVIDPMIKTLPMPGYNIFKNEYMVPFTWQQPETKQDPFITILDNTGKVKKGPINLSAVPANASHPYIVFNKNRREYLIVYNDSRYDDTDVFGTIVDEEGNIVKKDFEICTVKGLQFNVVACYNPVDDTYMVNWEDFRNAQTTSWLDPACDIYGVLLNAEGEIIKDNIEMCADTGKENEGDQRHNMISHNSDRNEFLVSWTDARPSLDRVGIMGRIIKSDGTPAGPDFTIADYPGAQIFPHEVYIPEKQQYLALWDDGRGDADNPDWRALKDRDIYVGWLDANGQPIGSAIPICVTSGVQRYSEMAYNTVMDQFLIVWRDEVMEAKGDVGYGGHFLETGGNIMGAIYGAPSFLCARVVDKDTVAGIEGANITVLGMPYMKSATTNIGGWFNIKADGQKSGKYFLFASKQGYKSTFTSVDYAGEALEVTIELEKR